MKDVTPGSPRRNLLLAVALSALILLGFDLVSYYGWGRHSMNWRAEQDQKESAAVAEQALKRAKTDENVAPLAQNVAPLSAVKRVDLDNGVLHLGYNLIGGRLDSLTLNKFQAHLGQPGGVSLLGDTGAYPTWVDSGWQAAAGMSVPDSAATWQQEASQAQGVLALTFKNTSGQTFTRTVSPRPGSYVVDVVDHVTNNAALPLTLRHYARVNRAGGNNPEDHSSWVNYSGPMGVAANIVREAKYDEIKKEGRTEPVTASGGWWGITQQYFMTALLPDPKAETTREFRYAHEDNRDVYSAAVKRDVTVPAGGQAEVRYSVYVGPKQDAILKQAGQGLERAIDWGWFEVIAKPLYHVLLAFYGVLHSWGLAIFAITLLLKVLTYPLASKTYRSMAKMKKIQPHVARLQEEHGHDRQALALKTMELYAAEKVNPLGGCWPTLIQIPIFFAMYKVVLVAFDLRHAPLGLWVNDLSVMDPWYVLPVLMGASMYVQMQMNPPASDPTQQMVFKWMPVMFTVMFLSFPAGLVFYWLCNNVLTIAQQYYIMKKHA